MTSYGNIHCSHLITTNRVTFTEVMDTVPGTCKEHKEVVSHFIFSYTVFVLDSSVGGATLASLWCSVFFVCKRRGDICALFSMLLSLKDENQSKTGMTSALTGVSNGCVLPPECPVDLVRHLVPHPASVCGQASIYLNTKVL